MELSFYLPTNVIAGIGVHERLDGYVNPEKKILIVTDKGLEGTPGFSMVREFLMEKEFQVVVYAGVSANPDEKTVKEITDFIHKRNIQQVIGLGGGSSIDAAKAACCMATNSRPLEDYQWKGYQFETPPLPLIAMPTTAGTGSEVTGVTVITSRNMKKGIKQQAVFPQVALIDAELTRSLPPYLTAITGMDALTHAVEAYLGKADDPIHNALALDAIKRIWTYLPKAFSNGDDMEARMQLLIASCMAGIAMDQAGLGIVHSLAGPVCSYLHLSHGLANAMLLPYGMEYNRIAREERLSFLAECMGVSRSGQTQREKADSAIAGTYQLLKDLELAPVIRDITSKKVDTKVYGENAAKMFLIKNNPRKAGPEDCRKLFETIFTG